MPGLALNTDGTGIPQTPVPVPVPNIAGYSPPTNNTSSTSTARTAPSATSTSTATPAAQLASTNASGKRPVPTPIVPPRAPQPAATTTVATAAQSTGASSPPRPPVSPITPPLNPVQFPPPRQSHSYSSHPAQTVVAPPPPEPIEFDTNPDVLALKSAISILQMQSNNAKKDMVTLQKAKEAALEDPEAFIADLENGRVRMAGDAAGVGRPGSSSSSSSSGADDNSGIKNKNDAATTRSESKPWSSLPASQNIYRCPPINWSQYAVTGESLDRLHNEQLARPSQGTPATVTPDGRYEFKGTGKQEEVAGIAAPYNPLRDKIERKKPKGPPR